MPVRIGICDDNIDDINLLSEYLYEYDRSLQISSYMDGLSLFEDCLESINLFDIIFLDIYMPKYNGVELAKKIRNIMKDVKIIFVTSSNDNHDKAFDVFAFHYMMKPLDKLKLHYVVNEAVQGIIQERTQQICFSYKGINYRIYTKDILYLESRDKIIYLHMYDNVMYKCYGKLDELKELLPIDYFIRCHQSYIINMLHITESSIRYFKVGEYVINISKMYQKEARLLYYEYLFKHRMIRGIMNEK